MSFLIPGSIHIKDFSVTKDDQFTLTGETLRVRYDLKRFLLEQLFDGVVSGNSLTLKVKPDAVSIPISSIDFHSLEGRLKGLSGRGVEIEQLSLQGDQVSAYVSGRVDRQKIDVEVSCFVAKEIFGFLPDFVTEQLVSAEGQKVQQLRFAAKGTWDRLQVSLISDLFRIEIKNQSTEAWAE